MLKHRFFPYNLIACVLVVLAVSFIGLRAYLGQIEAKAVKAFRSETPHEHTHNHTNHNHAHVRGGDEGDQEELLLQQEREEWLETGKLSPRVEAHHKRIESAAQENEERHGYHVIQQVITPDGALRQVVVPKRYQYEEGDAILKSEIVDEEYLGKHFRSEGETYEEVFQIQELLQRERANEVKIVEPDGTTHLMPDEYYDIESPYEQLEYTNKFFESIELGISMEEVEQKVASGELNVSLNEWEKRLVDETEAWKERGRLANQLLMSTIPKRPPLSDKPPVKVSFLPDEGEDADLGWVRKARQKQDRLGEVAQPQISEYESRIDDTRRPNHRSVSPELPSEHPEQQRITPSKQVMEDFLISSPENLEALIEAQISPEERMKAIFGEKLSPEHKGQSPPTLTQDAPEEELRRRREAGSKGAKQREQHGSHADAPPPSR